MITLSFPPSSNVPPRPFLCILPRPPPFPNPFIYPPSSSSLHLLPIPSNQKSPKFLHFHGFRQAAVILPLYPIASFFFLPSTFSFVLPNPLSELISPWGDVYLDSTERNSTIIRGDMWTTTNGGNK